MRKAFVQRAADLIFVTVGTQFGFDRLLDWVSDSLLALGVEERCIAQSGKTDKHWSNIELIENVDTQTFEKYIVNASLVISHAGMGTIIQCMENKKPLIIVPRLSNLGEHRNDHQVDTAEIFRKKGVSVATSRSELQLFIERPENRSTAAYSDSSFRLFEFIKMTIET